MTPVPATAAAISTPLSSPPVGGMQRSLSDTAAAALLLPAGSRMSPPPKRLSPEALHSKSMGAAVPEASGA